MALPDQRTPAVQWRNGSVQYRRCSLDPVPGKTLEALVREALDQVVEEGKRREHWKARIQTGEADIEGEEHALANHLRDTAEIPDPGGLRFIFGDLCTFRPGVGQALLQDGTDSRELTVGVMQAPTGSNFMGKLAHWLIVDNHVLLLQGQGTRRSSFERYLKWLLTQAGVIPHDSQIALVPGVELTAGVAETTKVTEIKLGPPPRNATEPPANAVTLGVREEQVALPAGERRGGFEWFKRVMEAFAGSAAGVDDLLGELGDEDQFRAQLILKFTKRRTVALPSLETAQAAFRNLDDDEISFGTTAGSKKGEQLRLAFSVRVRLTPGGVLDRDDVLLKMANAFRYFVENGYIAAGEAGGDDRH